MKLKKLLFPSLLLVTFCQTASAAALYWDGNVTTVNSASDNTLTTAQNWLSGGNWDNGTTSVPVATWTATDTATFGGTAGIVSLGASITTAGTTFSTAGYTLNLTATAGSTNVNLGALSGNPTINNTLSSGSDTLSFQTTNWAAFTGTLNVGSASQAAGSGKAAIAATANGLTSSATVNVNANGTLYVSAAATHAAPIVLNGGDTGETIGQLRVESGTWSGNVTLAGAITGANDNFVGNNGTLGTISGIIGETGGAKTLSKGGTGTLALSNNSNSYTGGTVVNAGTLRASLGGTAGAKTIFGAGLITVNSGATLNYFASSTGNAMSHANNITLNSATLSSEDAIQTYSGTITLNGTSTVNVVWTDKNAIFTGLITGSGTFNKSGNGTLILGNSSSTYTGAINVASGPLTLDYTTNNTSKVTGSAAITLGSNASLRFKGNASATTSQVINGLTLGGGNTITLDTATGQTLTADFTGSGGTGVFTNSGVGLVVNTSGTGTAQLKLPGTVANTAVLPSVLFNGGFAATNASNYVVGVASTVNSTASDLATWTTGTTQYTTVTASDFTNAVGAGVTIDGITFKDAAPRTVTIGTGNTLGITNGIIVTSAVGNNLSTITGGSLMASVAGGALNILNTDTQNKLTIASVVSDNSSSKLVKSGAGAVELATANTYAGGTTVNGGTLTLTPTMGYTAGKAQGAGTGNITVNTGAVLANSTNSNSIWGGSGAGNNRIVTLNGGSITMNGSEYVYKLEMTGGSVSGAGKLRSFVASAGSEIKTFASAAASSISSKVDLTFNDFTFNVADGAAANDLVISGVISQNDEGVLGATPNRGITKIGAGTLALSATSTYTGITTVSEGTLALTGGGGSSGTIRGTVNVASGATLRLASGDVTGYGTTGQITAINVSGTLDINNGSGGFPGNQTLGNCVITLTGGAITGVAPNSKFDFFQTSSALASAASATSSTVTGADLSIRQTAGLTITVADGAAADDLIVNSVIFNNSGFTAAPLIKAGQGLLLLNGVNTYTGATQITGGTLKLGATGSIAATPSITIASGAVLDASLPGGFTLGTGKTLVAGNADTTADILGNLTSTGTITPAGTSSVGTLTTTGSLTLGGTLNIDRNAGSNASDSIAINGSLTIQPGLVVNVASTGTPTAGVKSYTVVSGITSISGTANLPAVPGFVWDTSSDPTKLKLVQSSSNLFWRGNLSNDWDYVTANWNNGAPGALYIDADFVTFDESASGSGAVTVNIPADVTPGSVLVSNTTARDYTIQSSGAVGIVGSTSLVKTGNGLLNLLSDNLYTGGTTISDGILNFGINGLGHLSGITMGTLTMDGGTLRWNTGNTQDISSHVAMVNGKAATFDTNGNDVSFGTAVGGSTSGSLVKNGAGILGLATTATYTGGTIVNGGTLSLDGGGGAGGTIRGSVTVNAGATLRLNSGDVTGYDVNNQLTAINLNGGTMHVNVTGGGLNQTLGNCAINMTGGAITGVAGSNLDFYQTSSSLNSFASATPSTVSGPMISIRQSAGITVTVADGPAADDLIINSVIRLNGAYTPGSLIKAGAGKLVLNGVNTYTTSTVVNAGTLVLSDNARLAFKLGNTSTNTISGAGTVVLDGDFAIDTSLVTATTGTWVLENVPSLTGPYGSTFTVVNPDGSMWTDAGNNKWTKVSGTNIYTFDETTGTLTLGPAGYDSWVSQITNGKTGRTQDADDDGFTNLQEFLFGTNPMANTASLVTTTSSGGNLVLRWLQRKTGSSYSLKQSTTLASGSWITPVSPVGVLDSIQTGAPTDYEYYKVTISIGSGKDFFRIEGVEN